MASATEHRARTGQDSGSIWFAVLAVLAGLMAVPLMAVPLMAVPLSGDAGATLSGPTVFGRMGAQATRLASNRPPAVTLWSSETVATIGRTFTARVWVSDPDGSVISVNVSSAPTGVARQGTVLTFVPDRVGTLSVTALVTDNYGAVTTATLTVPVHHRAQPELFVAMGDSVPAGAGLDPLDYLRDSDPCWRSERFTYPKQVFDRLDLGDDARFELVACAGHTTTTLADRPVSVPGPEDRTQLDWAVEQNPGLITLSIGANNLRFDKPQELFDSSGALLEDEAARRLDSSRSGLDTILNRLVAETNARIVVTTYHNPSGDDPAGVPGCRGACFLAASSDVTARLNEAIRAAVAAQPSDRVLLADVGPRFVGHGAPNGFGPDVLRNGGAGWLSRKVGALFGGVQAFCDRSHGNFDTWVSAIDCIHPNVFGHDIYADVVTETIRNAGSAT